MRGVKMATLAKIDTKNNVVRLPSRNKRTSADKTSPVIQKVHHPREQWLFDNPVVLEGVLAGIKQAEEGKLVSRGSFSEFADVEIGE
jgi:hypothetical protein